MEWGSEGKIRKMGNWNKTEREKVERGNLNEEGRGREREDRNQKVRKQRKGRIGVKEKRGKG